MAAVLTLLTDRKVEPEIAAEAVLEAERGRPGLFEKMLNGQPPALAAERHVVAAAGRASGELTEDEQVLYDELCNAGKSGVEIQMALDHLRAGRKTPTAEDRRNTPGVAFASTPLMRVDGPWLVAGKIDGNGASISSQVGERLVGRKFVNFKAFREAFWKAVAATPEIARQFNDLNQKRMRNGSAPFAPVPEDEGRSGVWELHHSNGREGWSGL